MRQFTLTWSKSDFMTRPIVYVWYEDRFCYSNAFQGTTWMIALCTPQQQSFACSSSPIPVPDHWEANLDLSLSVVKCIRCCTRLTAVVMYTSQKSANREHAVSCTSLSSRQIMKWRPILFSGSKSWSLFPFVQLCCAFKIHHNILFDRSVKMRSLRSGNEPFIMHPGGRNSKSMEIASRTTLVEIYQLAINLLFSL